MKDRFISTGSRVLPYLNAGQKYNWPKNEPGFLAPEGTINVAFMAGKHIIFKVRGYKTFFAIDPDTALKVAKQRRSFFKDKYGKLVAVIPKSVCYTVEKA